MSATSYNLLDVVQIAGFRAGNLKERVTTVEDPNPEMFNFIECVNEVLQRMSRVRPLPTGNGETVISTVDIYDTGTIGTATQGSETLSGLATSWTSIDSPENRALTVADRLEIYRIAFVSGDSTLDLTEPWSGASVSATGAAGVGYTIAQDRYDLPDDFADFISVTLEGPKARPLDIVRPSEIDQQRYAMSAVPMTLGAPVRCTLFHSSGSGTRQITVDPFPDDNYRLRIKYQKTTRRLTHNKDVVPVYDRNIFTLIDGVSALWKYITADSDAGRGDWIMWKREELAAYAAFDRETTDEIPHVSPDDVMRTARPTSMIS